MAGDTTRSIVALMFAYNYVTFSSPKADMLRKTQWRYGGLAGDTTKYEEAPTYAYNLDGM
jgi:hypothetical protein